MAAAAAGQRAERGAAPWAGGRTGAYGQAERATDIVDVRFGALWARGSQPTTAQYSDKHKQS